MYKLCIVIGILAQISCNSASAAQTVQSPPSEYSIITNNLLSMFSLKSSGTISKSGCCSWHGGVCGCTGSRQLCCDGSLSPSCTCSSYMKIPTGGHQS